MVVWDFSHQQYVSFSRSVFFSSRKKFLRPPGTLRQFFGWRLWCCLRGVFAGGDGWASRGSAEIKGTLRGLENDEDFHGVFVRDLSNANGMVVLRDFPLIVVIFDDT